MRACGAAESRYWLEKAIEGGSNVYLVVIYHTLVNARFTHHANSSTTGSVSGGFQVTAGSPGTTAVVDLTSTVNGVRAIENMYKRSPITIGEQIYAVQKERSGSSGFRVDRSKIASSNRAIDGKSVST